LIFLFWNIFFLLSVAVKQTENSDCCYGVMYSANESLHHNQLKYMCDQLVNGCDKSFVKRNYTFCVTAVVLKKNRVDFNWSLLKCVSNAAVHVERDWDNIASDCAVKVIFDDCQELNGKVDIN